MFTENRMTKQRYGASGRKPHYDAKQCFYAWMDAGSIERACQLMFKDGVESPKGGAPRGPRS